MRPTPRAGELHRACAGPPHKLASCWGTLPRRRRPQQVASCRHTNPTGTPQDPSHSSMPVSDAAPWGPCCCHRTGEETEARGYLATCSGCHGHYRVERHLDLRLQTPKSGCRRPPGWEAAPEGVSSRHHRNCRRRTRSPWAGPLRTRHGAPLLARAVRGRHRPRRQRAGPPELSDGPPSAWAGGGEPRRSVRRRFARRRHSEWVEACLWFTGTSRGRPMELLRLIF